MRTSCANNLDMIYMYIYIYVYAYLKYICIAYLMYICIYVYAYLMYICIYVYMYMCICVPHVQIICDDVQHSSHLRKHEDFEPILPHMRQHPIQQDHLTALYLREVLVVTGRSIKGRTDDSRRD